MNEQQLAFRRTPLRKCKECGLEAHTHDELANFAIHYECKFNRLNQCKKCRTKYEVDRRKRPEVKKWYDEQKESQRYKDYIKLRRTNSIVFHKKRLHLGFNPRENVCSICGKKYPEELKKQTSMHHERYDNNDPLAYTIEVCQSCHAQIHGLGIVIGVGRGSVA